MSTKEIHELNGKDCYFESLCPVQQVGRHLQQGYTQYLHGLWMPVRFGMLSQETNTTWTLPFFAGKCHLLDISPIFSSDTEQASLLLCGAFSLAVCNLQGSGSAAPSGCVLTSTGDLESPRCLSKIESWCSHFFYFFLLKNLLLLLEGTVEMRGLKNFPLLLPFLAVWFVLTDQEGLRKRH